MASNTIKFTFKLNVDGQEQIVTTTASARELQEALNGARGSASKVRDQLILFNQASEALSRIGGSLSALKSSMEAFTGAYNNAAQATTKLRTVMEQRMKATQGDIEMVNKAIAAETELGVVGGTVQRSGAQQMATFLGEASSLKTLIPAMNDLLTQQRGINATSEDAVGVANLMGKAMQGQTGALRRVGITFTEAQAKVMKYGTEEERAAMLAEIITDNVGHMNRALAQTDAGHVKQLGNEFGGLMVKIGSVLSPYQTFINQFAMLGMGVSAVLQVASAFMGLAKALGLTRIAMAGFRAAQASFAAMQNLITASVTGTTLSLRSLRAGIKGTIASLGLIGLAYMALSTALEFAVEKLGLFGNATDNLTESQRRQAAEGERAAQRNRSNADIMGRSSDSLVGKYQTLKEQYAALGSVHEKNAWIKKNQGAFGELGMSVRDVNDAYDYFVKNSDNVIKALTAIADARAWEEIYTKDRQAYLEESRKPGTVANGAYHAVHKKGEKIEASRFREMGLGKGDAYLAGNRLHLTAQGAENATQWEERQAQQRQRRRFTPLRRNMEQSRREMQRSQRAAITAQAGSGIDMSRNNAATTTPAPSTVRQHTGRGAGTPVAEEPPAGSMAALNKAVDELEKKRERLTDTKDIAAVDAEIRKLKDDVEALNFGARSDGFKASAPAQAAAAMTPSDLLRGKGASADQDALGIPQIEIPAPGTEAFKKGLEELSASIDDANKEATESLGAIHEAYENVFSSLGGNFSSTVNQWRSLGTAFNTTGNAGVAAGGSLALVGEQMQQIAGDGAAAKVGAMMAAIGQLVLGFATATAQAGVTMGPWGWIGFAIAGAATLASIIAQVSSFSTGGIVGGSSYRGDKVTARVNSGEMILTARQQKRLFDIANGMVLPRVPVVRPDTSGVRGLLDTPSVNVSVGGKVEGTTLKMVLRNTEKTLGKLGRTWG